MEDMQVINDREVSQHDNLRELKPEERLLSVDQDIHFVERALDTMLVTEEVKSVIGEEHLADYRKALKEEAGIGDRHFLDLVKWHNKKHPDNTILIPSDYVTGLGEVSNPEWLIPGLVLREGLTLFYGESGSYKTIISIYMGYSLLNGSPFFDIPIPGKHKVLYVEQDEGLSIFKEQVQKIGYPEDMFICCKLPVFWNNGRFNQEFYNTLKALRPDVVFIDAYTALGIEDITRPSSALCMDILRRIASESKLAFVVLHHENQSGKQMGSGLHIAKVDSEIQTTVSKGETSDTIMLAQHKVRGQHLEPMYLLAEHNTLHLQRRLNMTTAQMVRDMQAQGLDREAILRRFTGTQRETASKALTRENKRRNTSHRSS